MEMTLSVVRFHNAPPRQAMIFTVGESGCEIGRSTDNDVVLPDPDRWVSSHHATIGFRDGRFFLVDKSSNGTFLNNGSARVPTEHEIELNDGDELTIGTYDVRVCIAEVRESATDIVDPFGRRQSSNGAASVFDPFDQQRPVDGRYDQHDFQQGAAGGGDLLHRPVTASDRSADQPEGEATPDILDMVASDSGPDLGIGDPSADGVKPQPPESRTEPSQGGDGLMFGDLGEVAPGEPHIDLGGGAVSAGDSQPDHTPQENAYFQAPNAIPEDYDLLGADSRTQEEIDSEERHAPSLDESKPKPDLASPGTSEQADVRCGVTEAPVVPSPARTPMREMTPSSLPKPAGNAEEAVAAFLRGLGCADKTQAPRELPELMQTAGALLGALTEGLLSVMRSRSSFKSELRIEMTTIRSVENNPFKFSVDAEDALDNLLFRRGKGFLPPVQAAKEALDDVQAHEMAMLTGLRATLKALLARFDPTKLERELHKESVFDNLLPMAKKAKCWDALAEVYAEIAADTSNDFLNLFGDSFTQAYEEQIHKLKESRRRALD